MRTQMTQSKIKELQGCHVMKSYKVLIKSVTKSTEYRKISVIVCVNLYEQQTLIRQQFCLPGYCHTLVVCMYIFVKVVTQTNYLHICI